MENAAAVVRGFLADVRSGRNPAAAATYMAERVLAHQMNAENLEVVERSPANYTAHIEEFLALFGPFELIIDEFIAQDDKVYVRWRQLGTHLGAVAGYAPTGLPLVEVSSAVYRVADGHIVEYWIQTDRLGTLEQLRRNAASTAQS